MCHFCGIKARERHYFFNTLKATPYCHNMLWVSLYWHMLQQTRQKKKRNIEEYVPCQKKDTHLGSLICFTFSGWHRDTGVCCANTLCQEAVRYWLQERMTMMGFDRPLRGPKLSQMGACSVFRLYGAQGHVDERLHAHECPWTVTLQGDDSEGGIHLQSLRFSTSASAKCRPCLINFSLLISHVFLDFLVYFNRFYFISVCVQIILRSLEFLTEQNQTAA